MPLMLYGFIFIILLPLNYLQIVWYIYLYLSVYIFFFNFKDMFDYKQGWSFEAQRSFSGRYTVTCPLPCGDTEPPWEIRKCRKVLSLQGGMSSLRGPHFYLQWVGFPFFPAMSRGRSRGTGYPWGARWCLQVRWVPAASRPVRDSQKVTLEKRGVENFEKSVFNSLMRKTSHLKYFPVFGGNVTGILMGN